MYEGTDSKTAQRNQKTDTHERNRTDPRFSSHHDKKSNFKLTMSSPNDPPESPSKVSLIPSGVFLWRSLTSLAIRASVRGGKFSLELPLEALREYWRCMDPLAVAIDILVE
jgi:hypothetical protein